MPVFKVTYTRSEQFVTSVIADSIEEVEKIIDSGEYNVGVQVDGWFNSIDSVKEIYNVADGIINED